MKTFLLVLAAALTLAACQSSPTAKKVPAGVPPEETAAPPADTTSRAQ